MPAYGPKPGAAIRPQRPPKVEAAIAVLAGRGLAVEALGGEKRWATDRRDGMLDFVAAARRPGREAATIGVETGKVRPEQVTFAEEGRAALTTALAAVRAAFGGDPGFGGVAVHHYGSVSELGP